MSTDPGPPSTGTVEAAPRLADLLVAVLAVGGCMAVSLPIVRSGSGWEFWYLTLCSVLGGVALVGPPLIVLGQLHGRWRGRWRSGRIAWFFLGLAAWLTWPRWASGRIGKSPDAAALEATIGIPLLALLLTVVATFYDGPRLLTIRPGRHAPPEPWPERAGRALGLLGAALGLVAIGLIAGGVIR